MPGPKASPCPSRLQGQDQGRLVKETMSGEDIFICFWDLRASLYAARSMSLGRSNGACSSSSWDGVPGWDSRREDVADELGALWRGKGRFAPEAIWWDS
jgi:hypothetical protein